MNEENNIIAEVYKNFSVNYFLNKNNEIKIFYVLCNKLYKNKTKKNYEHVHEFKRMYFDCLNLLKNDQEYLEYSKFLSIKRFIYKDNDFEDEKGKRPKNYPKKSKNEKKSKKEKKSIINYFLSTFKVRNLPLGARIFLVETNSITSQCRNYQKIEEKIRSIGQDLYLNITEVTTSEDDRGYQKIERRIRTNSGKSFIYSFAIMIDNKVHYISEFFSLISFKQFSKRQGSFMNTQYKNFKGKRKNQFLYYAETFFKTLKKNQKIPRFRDEFMFSLDFFDIISPLPELPCDDAEIRAELPCDDAEIRAELPCDDAEIRTELPYDDAEGLIVRDDESIGSCDTIPNDVDSTHNNVQSPSMKSDITFSNEYDDVNYDCSSPTSEVSPTLPFFQSPSMGSDNTFSNEPYDVNYDQFSPVSPQFLSPQNSLYNTFSNTLPTSSPLMSSSMELEENFDQGSPVLQDSPQNPLYNTFSNTLTTSSPLMSSSMELEEMKNLLLFNLQNNMNNDVYLRFLQQQYINSYMNLSNGNINYMNFYPELVNFTTNNSPQLLDYQMNGYLDFEQLSI